MAVNDPVTELDARYGEDGVAAMGWSEAEERLAEAQIFWLSTVRPDGRPHVTPLLSVWLDGVLYFCTGADERKAKNLAGNANCVLTTGSNALHGGVDLVVEGEARIVRDEARLRIVADRYEAKYGPEWHFDVADGAFGHDGHVAVVYEVAPGTAFGFGKDPYRQTRWRFDR